MKVIPSIVEIRNQILSDIKSASTTTPLNSRGFIFILATAQAGALWLLYRFGQWVYKQIFVSTADDEGLTLHAKERGVSRKPASKFAGVLRFKGSGSLPSGTALVFEGKSYVTTSTQKVVVAGFIDVDFRSPFAGSIFNRKIGEKLRLVTPVLDVERDGEVVTVSRAGEEQESIDSFRSRVLARVRYSPGGGTDKDFIRWTSEVPGIATALISRPAPGVIHVAPVADNKSRFPSNDKLLEVEKYLTDENRLPVRISEVVVTPLNGEIYTVRVFSSLSDFANHSDDARKSVDVLFKSFKPGDKISEAIASHAVISTGYHPDKIELIFDRKKIENRTLPTSTIAIGIVSWGRET